MDLDHIDYTHYYNGLKIHVFEETDEDIILWMRQVIGNRILESDPSYFDYLMDAAVYVGYRADGDLESIIENLAQRPGCLHDEDKLLQLYDSEILAWSVVCIGHGGDSLFSWAVAKSIS